MRSRDLHPALVPRFLGFRPERATGSLDGRARPPDKPGMNRAGRHRPILGCIILALIALQPACRNPRQGYQPAIGDVLFQSLPPSPLVDAIDGATGSPFFHYGIVVQPGTKWLVLEAIGPVEETPLDAWIKRGRFGGFAAYRFKPKYLARVSEVIQEAEKYQGRRYGIHYRFDNDEIDCSELIFVAFKKVFGEDLGTIRKLGDLNWGPYAEVIFRIEGSFPTSREMITPVDSSKAPQLDEIIRANM